MKAHNEKLATGAPVLLSLTCLLTSPSTDYLVDFTATLQVWHNEFILQAWKLRLNRLKYLAPDHTAARGRAETGIPVSLTPKVSFHCNPHRFLFQSHYHNCVTEFGLENPRLFWEDDNLPTMSPPGEWGRDMREHEAHPDPRSSFLVPNKHRRSHV